MNTALGQGLDIDRNLSGDVFLEAGVHELESESDGHGGYRDADEKAHLLPKRRGADQVPGLEILGSGASDGCGDAYRATDHQGEDGILGGGPAAEEEDAPTGHDR